MKKNNSAIISSFLDAIAIESTNKLLYDGKEYTVFATSDQPASVQMLSQNLQNLFYTRFYCADKDQHTTDAPYSKTEDFITALSNANFSREKWEYGWSSSSNNADGSVQVKKGSHSRIALPGEFIKNIYHSKNAGINENIKILMRRELADPEEGFYYSLGENLTETNEKTVVRFYFNFSPATSLRWIRFISCELNKYAIPYSYKCLNNPSHYTRSDSAVLYIDKRYTKIVYDILLAGYRKEEKNFKQSSPLFTKKIGYGFSFAESPLNPAESFGMSRSRLIAEAILKGREKKQETPGVEEIIAFIESVGYSVDCFYLNPSSHWQYDFFTN